MPDSKLDERPDQRQHRRPPHPAHRTDDLLIPTTSDRDESSENAPPVMWPDSGSGFVASQYSPAGLAQILWRASFANDRKRLYWRICAISFLFLVVLPLLVTFVVSLRG